MSPRPTHAPTPASLDAEATHLADPASLRRAPRLGRFVGAGIVLGALLALALTFLPGRTAVDRADLFWLLFLATGFLGAVLGAVAHLVADRRSMRDTAADVHARTES